MYGYHGLSLEKVLVILNEFPSESNILSFWSDTLFFLVLSFYPLLDAVCDSSYSIKKSLLSPVIICKEPVVVTSG